MDIRGNTSRTEAGYCLSEREADEPELPDRELVVSLEPPSSPVAGAGAGLGGGDVSGTLGTVGVSSTSGSGSSGTSGRPGSSVSGSCAAAAPGSTSATAAAVVTTPSRTPTAPFVP